MKVTNPIPNMSNRYWWVRFSDDHKIICKTEPQLSQETREYKLNHPKVRIIRRERMSPKASAEHEANKHNPWWWLSKQQGNNKWSPAKRELLKHARNIPKPTSRTVTIRGKIVTYEPREARARFEKDNPKVPLKDFVPSPYRRE